MRERITLQTATETLDDAGQTLRTWEDTFQLQPASWMPMRGQETLRGEQVEAGITDIFVIRFRTDVVPQMRVVFGNQTYGIVYVKQSDGGRRYLELLCKSVV